MIKPRPRETVIKCTGEFLNGAMVWSENCDRIAWLVKNHLKKIAYDASNWATLYQDPDDLRFWEFSYPHAEMYGGGPPMLECLDEITEAYRQVKSAVNKKLYAKGYETCEEKYNPESFGSRYIVWSNHQHLYRLIWDGKESLFALEYADSLPILPSTAWTKVFFKPYNYKIHGDAYLDKITQQFFDVVI